MEGNHPDDCNCEALISPKEIKTWKTAQPPTPIFLYMNSFGEREIIADMFVQE